MATQKVTAAKKPKKKMGRPRASLAERVQIRVAPEEWDRWTEHAISLGFGSASAWLRKLAHDAMANGTPSL